MGAVLGRLPPARLGDVRSAGARRSPGRGEESSTPRLVLPDGEVVHDSNKILPRLHELSRAAEGAAYSARQRTSMDLAFSSLQGDQA